MAFSILKLWLIEGVDKLAKEHLKQLLVPANFITKGACPSVGLFSFP